MSNYTKTTNFAAKDSLPSGDAAKIVKGTEIDTEFNNIATASATKADAAGASLTGTTTFETISDGTISITAFVDEDNMASNSATLLPTQQSVKAYVDASVFTGVADGSITTAKLADDAVTAAKLASNAVVTASIVDDNVTQAKIADDAVGADQLAASAVVTASIVDDAVTAAKLASNAVVTASIVDDNVTQAKIADDAVGADQLAASAVVTASIVDDAVTSAKIADDAITSALIADDAVVAAAIADNAVDIARLNVSDGSSGQVLTTNGSGVLSFATVGGAYNSWLVKTSAYTAVAGDQIIVNSSSATTITLPASASAGNTVIIKATGGGTVTVGRNSQKINSTAADGTILSGSSSQLVFVDATIGFLEI